MGGNYANNGAHTPFRIVALNGFNSLSYRGCAEQSLPLLFRTVYVVYEASMYVVDDNSRSCWRYRGLDDCLLRHLSLPASYANILF